MKAPMNSEFEQHYAALTERAGVVDFSDRTQLEITGNDRAQFLHNLCTNAVRDLRPGGGCETLVLNVKGHVIGHVLLFATEKSHVLETTGGQAEKLMAHFDRYILREDVQIQDRSGEWGELLLAGQQAEAVLDALGVAVPQERLSHGQAQVAGSEVWVRRTDLTGPVDFLLAMPRESVDGVRKALIQAGASESGNEVAEAARIERGTPYFGRDISDENLPQEVDRDRVAISFTKGCYLGQETVARIDALGHVNRLLRGVRFGGSEIPAAGTELTSEGKGVGRVTSTAWSPKLGAPLALAYVRRGQHEPGTKLESQVGPAEVVALPIEKD